jgi:hypothetical protein
MKPKKKPGKTGKGKRLLKDLIAYLKELPAFTFVLCGGTCSSVGPTLASAIEMVTTGGYCSHYYGPFPETAFAEAKTEAAHRYSEIVESVSSRVEQIQENVDVSFVLYWQAFGDANPHLDFSAEHEGTTALDAVKELFLEIVADAW